ncbi:MAG TPA: hypothetical protein VGR06_15765 [Actinophytocola sp.]|jgi:hypothetical protein|uniref:hypothetical protein n=1 Tax=Actinophytocola sp. TaxID=1872138 RepID=UPI002E03EE59|nr:hypothetical protein [Actinophytocola sp.]
MRKLYAVGMAAVAAAALTVTGGSAATAGVNSSPDAVVIPSWVSNGTNFQDDMTGCGASHRAHLNTSETSILP